MTTNLNPLVSVIIPVKNGERWLKHSLGSVLTQTYTNLEVAVFDDNSQDNTLAVLEEWKGILGARGINLIVLSHKGDKCKMAGHARNACVYASTGSYLCFLDVDDVMYDKRVEMQLAESMAHPDCIIGSNFVRDPPEATLRYSQWTNALTNEELILKQHREIVIIQPTWFMSREAFMKTGGYDETGAPEDLLLYHKHLELGGGLRKITEPLIMYRYHDTNLTFSIHRLTILKYKLEAFERRVLSKWPSFTIWGAGRDGKKFFMLLTLESKRKVAAFCDVSEKKIGTTYVSKEGALKIPIIHFSQAKPPICICVAMDRTNGEFEKNVSSLSMIEGEDYWHFN